MLSVGVEGRPLVVPVAPPDVTLGQAGNVDLDGPLAVPEALETKSILVFIDLATTAKIDRPGPIPEGFDLIRRTSPRFIGHPDSSTVRQEVRMVYERCNLKGGITQSFK